jgi:hypothetical protein
MPVDGVYGKRREDDVQSSVSSIQSRLMLGHCFGAYATPGGTALFCFGYAALRVTASIEIFFGKGAEKMCDGPTVNAELGAWESRPLAWLRPV